MSTLKSTIESLASQFASSIVSALRSAPIDELNGYTGHTGMASAPRSAGRAASAPAPKASSAPAPKAAAAPAPAKRGPGRPKKTASAPTHTAPAPAAAPKKRGRPAGSGKKTGGTSPSAPAASSGGRLGRRSVEDIGRVVEDIVSLLGQHPEGLRSEQLRSSLRLDAKELPRPLQDGLNAGTITKVGQKRATTYFAGKGKKKK